MDDQILGNLHRTRVIDGQDIWCPTAGAGPDLPIFTISKGKN